MIGLITLDLRLGSRVKEIASRLGAEVIHVAEADELPLKVRVVILSKKEGVELSGREVIYIEDYGSVEELVERAYELALGKRSYELTIVAIDPGKSMGAAYILDNKLIKTRRYGIVEKLVDDVKRFMKAHRLAKERYVLIGSTTSPEDAELIAEKIRRALYDERGLKVMLVDEFSTSKGLLPRMKGVSKDEYSAILLSIKNLLGLR